MKGVYGQIKAPGKVTVAPLLFNESDLDAQTFLSMMAVGASDAAPLYMQIVLVRCYFVSNLTRSTEYRSSP